jgi:ferredoxin--NADP+ reductase
MLLTVTEVEHYSDTLFRIRTERPSTFRFTAGEFIMLGVDDSVMRAYSITSGPYDDELEFYSIKAPNGLLTSKLQHIKVGDRLKINEKSTGSLILANIDLGGHLWMLATGTGIAPFISLLRDPETYDAFEQIHVIWSVRNQAELAAYDSFLSQADVRYVPIVTRDPTYSGETQRITQLITDNAIVTHGTPEKNKVMMCGSMPFNKDVKRLLTNLGWQEGTRKAAGTFVQEKAFVL